jgi:HD-like signal output (HDOD) protein
MLLCQYGNSQAIDLKGAIPRRRKGSTMESNRQQDILKFVSQIKDLPTLPTVMEKIVTLTRDPDVSIAKVEEAIATDPVISTKLLRIVNSAYFSFFREITSLRQAIVVLGLEATKNLVYGTSIISAFGRESKIAQFPLEGIWKYSVACGNISRTLASLLDYSFYEEAFLAGLVHNIGKIVLAKYRPDDFEKSVARSQKDAVPLSESEVLFIGFDHNDIGHHLSVRWRLPQLLDEVITYNERPAESPNQKELTSIVRLASLLCRSYGIGISGEPPVTWEIQQDIAWSVLSQENDMLEILDFERFRMTLDEEVEKVESFVKAVFSS